MMTSSPLPGTVAESQSVAVLKELSVPPIQWMRAMIVSPAEYGRKHTKAGSQTEGGILDSRNGCGYLNFWLPERAVRIARFSRFSRRRGSGARPFLILTKA